MRPSRETLPFGPTDRDRFVREARAVLRRRPEVVAAWLHGSGAHADRVGDLDVAVLFDASYVEPAILSEIARELQVRGAPDGPEVDVRPFGRTPPRFRAAVLRKGILLYERSRRERIEHEARSMGEWLDFRPTWDLMRRRMRRRWGGG